MPRPLATVRRGLVVKLSSMGVSVLVTPCPRTLRRGFIAMAVDRRFAPFVRHSPHLDEVIEVDPGQGRLGAWLDRRRLRGDGQGTEGPRLAGAVRKPTRRFRAAGTSLTRLIGRQLAARRGRQQR